MPEDINSDQLASFVDAVGSMLDLPLAEMDGRALKHHVAISLGLAEKMCSADMGLHKMENAPVFAPVMVRTE